MPTTRRRKQQSNNTPLEVTTQQKIATFMSNKGYEVRREVKTPVGKLDILVTEHTNTNKVRINKTTNLIECKRHHDVNSLKSAIGQLRSYSVYYPQAKLIICTEDKKPLSKASERLLDNNKDIRLVVI